MRSKGESSAAARGGLRPAPRALSGRIDHLFRQIGPGRLIVSLSFIVLALVLARFSCSIPLADDAERALYDVRATVTAPKVGQDDRIVLVVYTEDTLAATGKRSPLDRALLSRALTRIDAMHPKAIGIDLLIDQEQPEDNQLVASLRSLRTPTALAFATNRSSPTFIQPWQEAFLRAFHARLAGSHVRPASVNIDTDPDGAARRWPARHLGLPALLALTMSPGHPEFRDYTGGIVFRQPKFADKTIYASFPIDLFTLDAATDMLAKAVKGRFVLVGVDLPDVDRFATPATTLTRADTSGLEVHANMLAQEFDGRRLAPIPPWVLWAAAVTLVLVGAITGASDVRRWWIWPVMTIEVALLIFVPFWVQTLGFDTRTLPMFGWGAGWAVACAAVAAAARSVGAEQRQFAQSALGKYLPRDIAAEILRDPKQLTLQGEKREIYAVFTDLEGFTKLSHLIEPETVALLVNRYLDMLSDVVLEHGGTIDKFVGDSVVAFWGAPIAKQDDADRAARAAIAMHLAGEAFRRLAPEGTPPFGKTRVGLHRGSAIVGNFGGEGRIQYTAFGDSMNTASRLEGANKQLDSGVLISAQAAERVTIGGLRAMGRVILRGRATPIEVVEPKPDFPEAARERLNRTYERFDAGETEALKEIVALAAEFPGDGALQNLVLRLEKVGPGGAFVLT
ncbi:MAG TPA: adenylate/guanylate cyclase domain-containing protein [Caulobacteraceae bacterium]